MKQEELDKIVEQSLINIRKMREDNIVHINNMKESGADSFSGIIQQTALFEAEMAYVNATNDVLKRTAEQQGLNYAKIRYDPIIGAIEEDCIRKDDGFKHPYRK